MKVVRHREAPGSGTGPRHRRRPAARYQLSFRADFPIALFTPEDRVQIRLPTLKPQLLRARVEDNDQSDPQQLEEPVRAGLRAVSIPATRGRTRGEPPPIYLDQVAG